MSLTTDRSREGAEDEHDRRTHDRGPVVPDRYPGRADRGPRPTYRSYTLADRRARARSIAGRAARDDAEARPLLEQRVRLARVRGTAERTATVHDRDRRRRHPLHPRAVPA